jgi:alkylation response protein AidB-like acyl-CoA dehydrogenase
MRFAFTDEQEELRATARAFLAEHSASEQVRAGMQSELGFSPELWKRIATELGWPAVSIPEEYGGLGLGPVELCALLEVMGEALLCAPFFSTVCLGANALLVAASEEQKQALLPAIAEGRSIATLAAAEPGCGWNFSRLECVVRHDGGEVVLDGRKRFVLDGHCADLLVVAARLEGSRGDEGISLFAVPAESAGVERRLLPTLDQTRRLAEIDLHGVRLPAAARLGHEGGGAEALAQIVELAAIALAAEQVGGAQRCLDLAVAHAKGRVQFGRPIGSFQAIQHRCADMMLRVESARSAAYYAACVAAERGADRARVASLAKAYCSDAYFQCAADALQIHGGVGFTWEYDVHLHLKRAKWSESFLGDPAWHRERVARLIGMG